MIKIEEYRKQVRFMHKQENVLRWWHTSLHRPTLTSNVSTPNEICYNRTSTVTYDKSHRMTKMQTLKGKYGG